MSQEPSPFLTSSNEETAETQNTTMANDVRCSAEQRSPALTLAQHCLMAQGVGLEAALNDEYTEINQRLSFARQQSLQMRQHVSDP